MSKLLSFFVCLIVLAAIANANEAGNSQVQGNGNDSGSSSSSSSSSLSTSASLSAPIWLSATPLGLGPSYPIYGGANTLIVQEPTYARVGEIVQKVPTAVSHQSQTVVHNHADVVTPIVAPAVRTQVLRSYNGGPYVYAATSYLNAQQAAAARRRN